MHSLSTQILLQCPWHGFLQPQRLSNSSTAAWGHQDQNLIDSTGFQPERVAPLVMLWGAETINPQADASTCTGWDRLSLGLLPCRDQCRAFPLSFPDSPCAKEKRDCLHIIKCLHKTSF